MSEGMPVEDAASTASAQAESSSSAQRSSDAIKLPVQLHTTISHQILTLLSTAFLLFELVFLTFYFEQSWFGIDLIVFGLPAVLACVLLTHFLLIGAESNLSCRLFGFIFKGKPPLAYKKWLRLENDGIVFGTKHLRWEALDELELTMLGNLVVKSRLLCGAQALHPDKVLKFPFGITDFSTQDLFLAAAKEKKDSIIFNERLSKGRASNLRKGAQATQLMSAAIMSLLLLDVGYSSFYYLELLKNYYLAETELLEGKTKEAAKHFERAEELRLHPLAISWVSAKFLGSSNVAAGIWEQRSHILYLQGKKEEAVEDSRKAVIVSPSNLRHRLYLTRLLVETNKLSEARENLEKLMEEHKHSFMPRLYILAMTKEQAKDNSRMAQEYKTQLDACYEDTYDAEPHWPPGGNRYFMELFYSDDSRFLLDRFLETKYVPTKTSGEAPK